MYELQGKTMIYRLDSPGPLRQLLSPPDRA